MDFSPNLTLPYVLPNQAQKHVTVNESLRRLDAVTQIHVASRTDAVPPVTPVEGESFIPAAGASGDWAGLDGQLVCFQDGAWAAFPPKTGWQAFITEENGLVVFDGTDWVSAGDTLGEISLLGINASADLTNRFAMKGLASLFDHDGGDHQLKINKAADTDTASLLFQSGYSGHAEMGLIGDTDFAIKVSPDGAVFDAALTVQASDSYVGLGTDAPLSRLHVTQSLATLITIEATTAGSGAGFDIINTGDGQNWRFIGQQVRFKVRDHTAGLDKLHIESGATGDVLFQNCGNVGIDITAPSAKLHVDGAVRLGTSTVASLPDASTIGAGAMLYVSDASGGSIIAFSDGSDWRRISDRSTVS